MCAGGLVASRLGRLVFGATDPKAGACGSLYNLCTDPRLNHDVTVTSGVRATEVSGQLRRYFEALRRD
jgi:tRNA(adenine34) deaminase